MIHEPLVSSYLLGEGRYVSGGVRLTSKLHSFGLRDSDVPNTSSQIISEDPLRTKLMYLGQSFSTVAR